MSEIIRVQDTALSAQGGLTEDTYLRFVAFADVKEKSVQTYTRALRQMFKYFAENGISNPQRDDIINYRESLKERGLKPSSVQAYITAARLFFAWTEQERIYPNIAAHVKGAKINREHKKDYLTTAQCRNTLAGIDRSSLTGLRDYAIVTLTMMCALRTIEVSRADIGDLRTLGDDTALYVQGKGRDEKAEFVKVPPEVEDAIRAYLKARGETDPSAPLFCSTSNNSKGERMTTRSISGICKAAMVEAGYNSSRLTAHSLRHTGVTLALLNGETLEQAQKFARHSQISTTMIYNHAIDAASNSCSATVAKAVFG